MLKIDIKRASWLNWEYAFRCKLEIKNGDFIALGSQWRSGKTTLLRILAGLEEAKGRISIDNEIWQDEKYSFSKKRQALFFKIMHYFLIYDSYRKSFICK